MSTELTMETPGEGCGFRCTACGATTANDRVRHYSHPDVRAIKRSIQQRLSFRLDGCTVCGHIMAIDQGDWRDLTRAEADELAAHPDFPRVRDRVLEAVGHLVG